MKTSLMPVIRQILTEIGRLSKPNPGLFHIRTFLTALQRLNSGIVLKPIATSGQSNVIKSTWQRRSD